MATMNWPVGGLSLLKNNIINLVSDAINLLNLSIHYLKNIII